MGNSIGSLLGLMGQQQTDLAQSQYGQLQKQQMQAYLNTYATTVATNGATYEISGYGTTQTAPKKRGPETACEWLDRRVAEMRVSL